MYQHSHVQQKGLKDCLWTTFYCNPLRVSPFPDQNPILQLQLKSESCSSCRVNFSAALIRDTSTRQRTISRPSLIPVTFLTAYAVSHLHKRLSNCNHSSSKSFQLHRLLLLLDRIVVLVGNLREELFFSIPRMLARRRIAPLSRACVRERSVGLCIHVLLRFVCVGSSKKRGKLLLCWPLYIIIIIILCFALFSQHDSGSPNDRAVAWFGGGYRRCVFGRASRFIFRYQMVKNVIQMKFTL